MKAYKLIWELLKHPFAEVKMRGDYGDYLVAEIFYFAVEKDFLLTPPIDNGCRHRLDYTLEKTESGFCSCDDGCVKGTL